MKSVQESKNELEAAIRYAENAISSAKQTIESMEFRQEMAKKQYSESTGREAVLESELAGVRELLDATTLENVDLEERNGKLYGRVVEQTGRIAELEAQVNALEHTDREQALEEQNNHLHKEVTRLENENKELRSEVANLKEDMKDQRNFDQEVREAVKEFIEQLGTIGFEGA
tara:strand:+ start:324 stop:842 length:519 start_codon:yes stop_codon:yes gene_type:complete